MNTSTASKSPWTFFLLVFILSVPFWLIGAITEDFLQNKIPINLPLNALQAVTPLIAAVILTYRENGLHAAKQLLKRSVDYWRIKKNIWYVPAFCLMPLTYALAYGLMYLSGAPLPDDPRVPILMTPVLFVVFFVFAVGEEVGWTGYATDPLLNRWNALEASVILGIVWAILHTVPDIQAHHTLTWILWQRLGTVILRILFVWLYNNTGKSVFATVIFHTMSNVSFSLFPNYGSHYDSFFVSLVMALTAMVVILVWGGDPKHYPDAVVVKNKEHREENKRRIKEGGKRLMLQ